MAPKKKALEPEFDDLYLFDDRENQLPVIGEIVEDIPFEIFYQNKIKKVCMSDYEGKWLILFFYPADFTFVCPTELEELAEYYVKLKKLGAEVVSVSTDTVFVHKAWHDHSPAIAKVTFPMAADPTGRISRAFGVYIEDEGLALRGTFSINPKQELVAYEVNNNNIGRSVEELHRKLQAAVYVEKHGGEVCPASWKPGNKTLKPGIDLVGQI